MTQDTKNPYGATAEILPTSLEMVLRSRARAWIEQIVEEELEGMLGLRLGGAYDAEGFPVGEGYFVAAAYKEFLGARYVGVTIGYSIDAGTKRRHRVDVE